VFGADIHVRGLQRRRQRRIGDEHPVGSNDSRVRPIVLRQRPLQARNARVQERRVKEPVVLVGLDRGAGDVENETGWRTGAVRVPVGVDDQRNLLVELID